MAGVDVTGTPARSPFGARTRVRYRDRPMTRILLVRHGESTWNADGRWQGQADPPLSDLGRSQAAEAALRVGTVDAIVTSDLQRAADTGVILARLLGVDHVATEWRLRERDAGPLSGLTRAEVHARFPGLLADEMVRLTDHSSLSPATIGRRLAEAPRCRSQAQFVEARRCTARSGCRPPAPARGPRRDHRT